MLGSSGDVAQVRDLPPGVAAAFGLGAGDLVSRGDAMRVPTVRRARQVVCGTIGAQPLVAHRTLPDRTVVDVTDQRPLLRQPDPNTTLQYVLTWTADSLYFYGLAWWRVLDRDAQGYPTAAEWLAPSRVRVDLNAQAVYVDTVLVADHRDLIRFDGPDEGVLTYAGGVLGTSRLLEAAVRRLASGDVPLGALRLKEGAEDLSSLPGSAEDGIRSQIDELLDSWEEARVRRTTAYLNGAIDFQTFQVDARASQLAEGRQQQRIDEANVCNVPPRVVNAPSASSMTYSNALAERADLVDTSLAGLIVAIEQRLSMPDITPRTIRVRLDLTRYLSGDTLSALEAARAAVELGAMTPDEVRTDVLGRAPLTDEQRAALPAPPSSPEAAR